MENAFAGLDAYKVLGVARNSTDDHIKHAYHALALKLHPDKAKDSESRDKATEQFQQLQAAYQALSPSNRRRYDIGVGGIVTNRTLLMDACEKGDFSHVRHLLEQKADVHGRDSTGRTALMFAASAASIQIIKLLLQQGADIEARNCAGHSCVMFAVGAGLKVDSAASAQRALNHLDAARLLLDEGAPVDAATGYGLTALMLACTSGRMNIISLLLDRGADPCSSSDIGLTPLVMAADKGHAEAVRRLLVAAADPDCRYGAGKTPIMGAAALAHTSVVEALIEGQADVNCKTDDGHFALLYAVERHLKDGLACPISGATAQKPDAESTVLALLKAAANPNLTGPQKRTPLHVACVGGSISFVEHLVAAGARLDMRDEQGQSPADVALASGHGSLFFTIQAYDGQLNKLVNSSVSLHCASDKVGKSKGHSGIDTCSAGFDERSAPSAAGPFHQSCPLIQKTGNFRGAPGCPVVATSAASARCLSCLDPFWRAHRSKS